MDFQTEMDKIDRTPVANLSIDVITEAHLIDDKTSEWLDFLTQAIHYGWAAQIAQYLSGENHLTKGGLIVPGHYGQGEYPTIEGTLEFESQSGKLTYLHRMIHGLETNMPDPLNVPYFKDDQHKPYFLFAFVTPKTKGDIGECLRVRTNGQ